MATIPDPPEGGPGGGPPAATFQEIFDFVQAFAKDNGFAVVKMKLATSARVSTAAMSFIATGVTGALSAARA